jgi:hypothetical protein
MFRLGFFALVAIIVAMLAADANCEPGTGDIVGAQVVEGSKDVAHGVALASSSTAEALDGLTYGGCRLARWAAGGRDDRKASTGNAVVALFFRLPVAVLGGGTCAMSAALAVPMKGIGYGFGQLAGNDTAPARGMRIEDQPGQVAYADEEWRQND